MTYFLFSDSNENMLVTASHAIFVKERKRGKVEELLEAPVAVVGFQFDQMDLEEFIRNIIYEVMYYTTRLNIHHGGSVAACL